MVKNILKTPKRPLHMDLINLISSHRIFSQLEPSFHVKVLAAWQSELKCIHTFDIRGEEKICESVTRTYVDKFLADQNCIDHATSHPKMSKYDKTVLLPVACKYGGKHANLKEFIDRV